MCFFSAPKVPAPPMPAQFQAMKLPDGGTTNALADQDAKRRRALAATAFTGALGLGQPSTTASVLGG